MRPLVLLLLLALLALGLCRRGTGWPRGGGDGDMGRGHLYPGKGSAGSWREQRGWESDC